MFATVLGNVFSPNNWPDMPLNLVLMFVSLLLGATPERSVSVAYAASLASTMQGPISSALLAKRGIRFEGEPKGSKGLAHLIAAGLLTPDVFISADPALMQELRQGKSGGHVDTFAVFGSTRLVLGYSKRSRYRQVFEHVAGGHGTVWSLLSDARLRIGRSDPALDPKGARTVTSLGLLARSAHGGAGADVLAREAMFPEETLNVRLETGDLDAAFFYSTETIAEHIPAIELPGSASLNGKIRYAIAVLRDAPHPQAARTFEAFILHGPGRAILERAGLRYF